MPGMGRRPSKNLNLPAGMRARKRGDVTYYYFDAGGKPRREIPLGKDYPLAVRKWGELEEGAARRNSTRLITLRYAAEQYLLSDDYRAKAGRTQADYRQQLGPIYQFFDDPPAPLDSLRPLAIQQYMDWRGKTAPVRANRERALISVIWNFARRQGLTDAPNPCAGIKGYTELGRDIYVEDDVYAAVWQAADVPLREALDLAYLTGQRPADVLRMTEADIRDDMLAIAQSKTRTKLRMRITGQLAELLEGIAGRKREFSVRSLALICNEQGARLRTDALRYRFDQARRRAAKARPELAEAIAAYQVRDLRAKAGTDTADARDLVQAQKQLGHKSIRMTEHYVRARAGEKVDPTR